MRIRKCHQREGSFQQSFGVWKPFTCKEVFIGVEFFQMVIKLKNGKRDWMVIFFWKRNGR